MRSLCECLKPIGLPALILGIFLAMKPGAAEAQALEFTLSSNVQTISPGSVANFMATLNNTQESNTLSLDSSDVTTDFTGSRLTLTDNFASTPLTLSPGDSWTGTLFSVASDALTPYGVYYGSYEVDYTNLTTSTSYESVQNFEVDVIPQTTPEPGAITYVYFASGAGILALARRRNTKTISRSTSR